MSNQLQSNSPNRTPMFWTLALLAVLVGGYLTHAQWGPRVDAFVAGFKSDVSAGMGHAGHEDHADHDDLGHASHDDHAETGREDAIELTELQQRNLGLKTTVVQASDFVKHTVVQAVVVDRPGRSKVQVTAHAAGIVNDVFPLERQVVQPGEPLLKMRLIHEDIVGLQTRLLDVLAKKEVLAGELSRLESIGSDVIAGKKLISKRNEIVMVDSSIASIEQSLKLHGLDEEEIGKIAAQRQLLQEEIVRVPRDSERGHRVGATEDSGGPRYHVQTIRISRGQTVTLGQTLMTLADYSLLYVKGMAFEEDAAQLATAAREGQPVRVFIGGAASPPSTTSPDTRLSLDLKVESVSDTIDPESRELSFFLELPNQEIEDAGEGSTEQPPFVSWKFRPGQRMEVHLPSQNSMRNKIVLPSSAVVIDGPNAFLFEQNGDVFQRLEVEVLYRDGQQVVLENDGMLLGATVAVEGGYRMYLALKNESGGGFDPHAGHSH